MTDRNRTYQNERVSTHSDVQCGSANRQTSFSGRGNAWIKLPFSGHIANKFQRPTNILQLNIEGLTASKMNVLHHLAMQSEALVILLQETHSTDAEKLVLPNYQLAGSSLSRKHGLAKFVHERLRYTLLDQSPPTSEIEWLCVNADGYIIVNVTNHSQRDCDPWISQCFLIHVFTLAVLTVVMLTGVTTTTVRTVSAWLAGQVLIVLPCYIMPRTLPVFIPAAGTLAPIQI